MNCLEWSLRALPMRFRLHYDALRGSACCIKWISCLPGGERHNENSYRVHAESNEMLHVERHALVEFGEDIPVHVHWNVVAKTNRFGRLNHFFGRVFAGKNSFKKELVEEVQRVLG